MKTTDDYIAEVAKAEHQQLKDWLVKKAIALRRGRAGLQGERDFNDAVDVLVRFEEEHRERLDGKTVSDNSQP